ncbi:MAG: response regulator [Candidatus Wallbacteria bacterium]|nr:response regulator [Candidatus Wallbacteria bacterium]
MTGSYRVLVIDDEHRLLDTLQDSLSQDGFFEVVTAISGEEGLRIAETQLPDIIILDLMMPGLDGLELCRLLKGNLETKDIPIIVLTARDDITSVVEAFRQGATNYLLKPFDPARLRRELRNALAI